MISKEEVLKLAELARLKVSDEEALSLQKDISDILLYVGHVSTIEASKTIESPALRNVLRSDAPREDGHPLSDKEEALRAAFPTREGAYNVVRKIIQKDE